MNILYKVMEVVIIATIMVSLVILLGLFVEPSYTDGIIEAVKGK